MNPSKAGRCGVLKKQRELPKLKERSSENMLELSVEEKDAILLLGRYSDHELITEDILHTLIKKGLLHHRTSDGHLDMTTLGENIYDQLVKQSIPK